MYLLLYARLPALLLGHRLLVLGYRLLVLRHRLFVLEHRLQVLLRLSLGCFLLLLLPCSCSCICCFIGGSPCSFLGTGCGCFSDFIGGDFCVCRCRARARVCAASWATARACAQAPAAGVSVPWFGVVFAAVAAVLVLVYLLLHRRLQVLVLGHWPHVFLRNILVRVCSWCFCARAAVPPASVAAAGALTRASCVIHCAAVFPNSHPFLLAVIHQAMSQRTTAIRYLLCFPSQLDFFMTRKRGRGVLKAPKQKLSGH